jgi:hypothetical protein
MPAFIHETKGLGRNNVVSSEVLTPAPGESILVFQRPGSHFLHAEEVVVSAHGITIREWTPEEGPFERPATQARRVFLEGPLLRIPRIRIESVYPAA